MIIDTVDNWQHYPLGAAWKEVFNFLQTLTPDSEEKKYTIGDDDIFAQISSYKTCAPETTELETHDKYVDVQMVLSGGEKMECAPRAELEISVPYDSDRDVAFYKSLDPRPIQVEMVPGTFVMLFPHDAHMPELMRGGKAELVKKVVVKINAELLKV